MPGQWWLGIAGRRTVLYVYSAKIYNKNAKISDYLRLFNQGKSSSCRNRCIMRARQSPKSGGLRIRSRGGNPAFQYKTAKTYLPSVW